MGRADFYQPGDYNAQCYQCGFKRKASTMERNWQGYYVCPEHNEPRQTQDFVRGVPDRMQVPWAQPWPSPGTYTYTNVQLGIGDGITIKFQFGSGLGPEASTYNVQFVFVDGLPQGRGLWTVDDHGVITFIGVPPRTGQIVSATGTETQV